MTTLHELDDLVDRCQDWGIEIDVRPNYSGRGMMGNTCVGFVTDKPFAMGYVLGMVAQAVETETGDLPDWHDIVIAGAREDSMGYATIVYWPRWKVNG